MKTLTVKRINAIDTIYIFRDNNIEIEVRFEKNKVFSSLELTDQEKKDIAKLMRFPKIIYYYDKKATEYKTCVECRQSENNCFTYGLCVDCYIKIKIKPYKK